MGDRQLHWLAAGEGAPTVLLEAGLTAAASEWTTILPRLAETTRVLAVSRAGYGRSTPVHERRPARASIDDLEAVLDELGVREPIVGVGHSWGGILLRLLAARRPAQVAALVLVDATHEGLTPMRRAGRLKPQLGMTLAGLHARTGLLRRQLLAGRGPLGSALHRLAEPDRASITDELCDVATWQQARRDVPAVGTLLNELHRTPLPRLEVPVVAVVGTRGEGPAAATRALIRQAYEEWLPTQADGRLVLAPSSGHLVPQEDEDLLVEVIRALVSEVQASPAALAPMASGGVPEVRPAPGTRP